MKFLLATATAYAVGAFAAPGAVEERDILPIYGPGKPVILSPCPALHLNDPSNPAFPFAQALGTIVGPVLNGLLGAETVDNLDTLADNLCISSQEDPEDAGICQKFLSRLRDLIDAKTPLGRSQAYGCLLNTVCVAQSSPKAEGTCQQLLAGADCIANRVIGAKNLQCEKK